MNSPDPRVAVVTGGTRGIGRAIALRLAQAGMVPVLLYRQNEEAAERTLLEAQALAKGARAFAADLSIPSEVERVFGQILTALGRIDILVNNAFRGGRPPKKVHELDPAAWSEDLAHNLTGPFLCTRAALPAMQRQGGGRIIFLGSLAMRGERGRAAYVVAKNGLVGLARTVALEYAREGITSNVVCPGYTDAGAFLKLAPEIREATLKRVPMGRLGSAEEVAELVAYLVQPQAAYLTGQVIGIDGGAG